MSIEVDVRYGEASRTVIMEPEWTLLQTAQYLEDNVLDGGRLVPTTSRPADHVMVRPERDGEKWNDYPATGVNPSENGSSELTVAEASSLNSQGMGGPYQIRVYPLNALLVMVEHTDTGKMTEFSVEPDEFGKSASAFLDVVAAECLRRQAEVHELLGLEQEDEEKECSELPNQRRGCCRCCRKKANSQKENSAPVVYFCLDEINQKLLARFMTVGHEDANRMPTVVVQSQAISAADTKRCRLFGRCRIQRVTKNGAAVQRNERQESVSAEMEKKVSAVCASYGCIPSTSVCSRMDSKILNTKPSASSNPDLHATISLNQKPKPCGMWRFVLKSLAIAATIAGAAVAVEHFYPDATAILMETAQDIIGQIVGSPLEEG